MCPDQDAPSVASTTAPTLADCEKLKEDVAMLAERLAAEEAAHGKSKSEIEHLKGKLEAANKIEFEMKCRHDAVVSDLKNKLNLAPDEAALSKFKVEAQAERTAKEAALEELHKLKGEVAAHKVVPIPAPPARLMEKPDESVSEALVPAEPIEDPDGDEVKEHAAEKESETEIMEHTKAEKETEDEDATMEVEEAKKEEDGGTSFSSASALVEAKAAEPKAEPKPAVPAMFSQKAPSSPKTTGKPEPKKRTVRVWGWG